jgi:hypothetical protein
METFEHFSKDIFNVNPHRDEAVYPHTETAQISINSENEKKPYRKSLSAV